MNAISTLSRNSCDYDTINIVAKIHSKKISSNERNFKIINFNKLTYFYEDALKCHKDFKNITFFVEISENHWITLHVFNSKIAYYVDLWEDNLPPDLENYFKNENIKLSRPVRYRVYDSLACRINTLYYAIRFSEDFSGSDYPVDNFNDKGEIFKFKENIIKTSKQLNKMRTKLKVCFDLFSRATSKTQPVISRFEHANIFIFLIDALSLEDNAYKENEDLKNYVLESVIGINNCNVAKMIRYELLHREKKTLILPESFQGILFQEHNTKKAIENVAKYLNSIIIQLEVNYNDEDNITNKSNELEAILYLKEEFLEYFGNPFNEDDHKEVLCELSTNFLKKISSPNKSTQAHNMMFDFIVNFVPLLKLYYGKEIKPYRPFTDLRNQLVHNLYILYNSNEELPEMRFKSLFVDLKRYFIIFNLSHKILKYLKDNLSDENLANIKKSMNESYEKFKKEVTFDLNIKNNSNYLKIVKDTNHSYFIEQYLKTIPVIDSFNTKTIDVTQSSNFKLPIEYVVFSNEQRRKIFSSMILISKIYKALNSFNKATNESELSSKNEFAMLLDIVQNDLKSSTGLNEKDFESMASSIISNNVPENELLKIVSSHISTISTLINKTKSNINLVIEEYTNSTTGISPVNNKRDKRMRPLRVTSNKIFEIRLGNKFVVMDVKEIVKNIVPLLYGNSNETKLFPDTIEEAFNDKLLIEFLTNEKDIVELVGNLILKLDFLAPLAIQLLVKKKLKFDWNETEEFLKYYVSNILKCSNYCSHLADLFENKLALREDKFVNLICKEILSYISKLNISILEPLLKIENFQSKLFIILKSFFSKVPQNNNDYANHVEAAIMLLNFKYMSANKSVQDGECEKALEMFDDKKGLSRLLKMLIDKNVLKEQSNDVIEIKFMLAKIKINVGLNSITKTGYSDKDLNEALNILDVLKTRTTSQLPWNLCIRETIAYVNSLMEKYEVSQPMYFELFEELYFIINDKKFNTKEIIHRVLYFEDLFKSDAYINAISKDPQHLNILKLWSTSIIQEMYLGKRETNKVKKTKKLNAIYHNFVNVIEFQKKFLGENHDLTRSTLFKQMELFKMMQELANTSENISPIQYWTVLDYELNRRN